MNNPEHWKVMASSLDTGASRGDEHISPMEADGLAGAGLTPAVDRLRKAFDSSTRQDAPFISFSFLFVGSLIDLLTRCRDTLEAQSALIAAAGASDAPPVALGRPCFYCLERGAHLASCPSLRSPGQLTPLEQQLTNALRRLTREYVFTRTMDGTTEADCETMECIKAARAAIAKATGSAS